MTLIFRSLVSALALVAFVFSSPAIAADGKAGDDRPSDKPVDKSVAKPAAPATAGQAGKPAAEKPAVGSPSAKNADAKAPLTPIPSPAKGERKPDAPVKPAPPADSGKTDTPKTDDSAKTDRSLRELEIYVPYDKFRGVFEKPGRGVFLPYEKFEELWKAAQDKARPAAEAHPPVGAMITEIDNEAVVAKDVVQVTAHVKIDLLIEGWHEVPLRLADAAVVQATIKNEPARLLGGANEDHRLLIEKKGKQPEQVELLLEYARTITRSPGQNSVSFQAPQAAVSRWKVRIPQAGVKVNLYPLIAATEVPAAALPSPSGKEAGDKLPSPSGRGAGGEGANVPHPNPLPEGEGTKPGETVVLAFVGPAPEVRIEWTPKSEGATGLAAVASVQAEQQVSIQDRNIRSRTTLSYAISRAELSQLALEVPADFKVVKVFDPNVRQWDVEPPAAGSTVQKITAQLFQPAKTAQSVVVELEKLAGQNRQESLKAPVVKALNVGRQQGFVVVQVDPGLRAEAAKTTGLLQVDAAELPTSLRSSAWAFAYRYASVPFELELTVEDITPRITVDTLVEARLEPEKLALDVTALYAVERAGVFNLELDVPEGFELRSVTGQAMAVTALPGTSFAVSGNIAEGGSPAKTPSSGPAAVAFAAAEINSYRLEGEKKNHLVVKLAQQTRGNIGLHVQLQRDLNEPSLLAPTAKPADIELPVPRATKGTIQHSSGRLVICAPENLRVNPAKAEGLRPVSFQEAMEGLSAAPAAGDPATRPALAFRFTQEPVSLRLAVERRKPQVTVRQLLVAQVEEGVIKYHETLFYSIRYSGVKSLRIDVPADVAPLLRNTTAGIHEKTIDQPTDVEKGMVAWELTGEGELSRDCQIDLVWEKRLDKLEVGTALPVTVPRLAPRNVDRAWGQIVLAKAESLDVQEAEDGVKGLRPIDPQRDLATPVNGAARAFEFHDDWTLPVTITRYALDEVKRTSIERAVCRMVLTSPSALKPTGEVVVQAVYRIRSAQSRLTVKLPADATMPDVKPFCINGQAIAFQNGQGGELFVPLLTTSAEEPFVLEIRYTVPGGRKFVLPTFVDDPATQKVDLCVFVPPDEDVVRTGGPWAEDFEWQWGNQDRWAPFSPISHETRVKSVCEGNKVALGAAESFRCEGAPLIFSTLRPAPETGVWLRTIGHWTLNLWIFVLVLLAGAGLVFTNLSRRLIAVAALVTGLVVLGIFWPTLALHVWGGPLFWAMFIVLLLWAIVGLFRLYRPFMAFCAAIGTTWSTWVASRHAILLATAVPPPAVPPLPTAPPQDPPASAEGGASHD